MTATCNPIFFYDNPPPALSQILEKLDPHMYKGGANAKPTTTLSSKVLDENVDTQIAEPLPVKTVQSKADAITPNHQDSLFWCIYVIAHGYSDYLQISRNYGVRKLEVNKDIMTYMQDNMHKFHETNIKMTKIAAKVTLSELLSLQQTMNLNCMLTMCIFYKINVFLIDPVKNGMLKFISAPDGDNPTYMIYKGDNGIYSVDIEPIAKEKMEDLNTELICLDSSSRPLKAISHYKTDELVSLAQRLNIHDCNRKYKKAELYKEVSELLMW